MSANYPYYYGGQMTQPSWQPPNNWQSPYQQQLHSQTQDQYEQKPWHYKYTQWVTDSKPAKFTLAHPWIVVGLIITFIVAAVGIYQHRQSNIRAEQERISRRTRARAKLIKSDTNDNAPIIHIVIIVPPAFVEEEDGELAHPNVDIHATIAQTICELFLYAAQPYSLRLLLICFEKNGIMNEEERDGVRAHDIRRVYHHHCKQYAFPIMSSPQLKFVTLPNEEWFGYYKTCSDAIDILRPLYNTLDNAQQFVIFVHRGFRPCRHFDLGLLAQWRLSYYQLADKVNLSTEKPNADVLYQWFATHKMAIDNKSNNLPVLTQPSPHVVEVQQLQKALSRGSNDENGKLRTFDSTQSWWTNNNNNTSFVDWRSKRQLPGTFSIGRLDIHYDRQHAFPNRNSQHALFFDVPTKDLEKYSRTPIHTPWLDLLGCVMMPGQLVFKKSNGKSFLKLWRHAGNFHPSRSSIVNLLTSAILWSFNNTVIVNPTILIGCIDNVYYNTTQKMSVTLRHNSADNLILPHSLYYINGELLNIKSNVLLKQFEAYYGFSNLFSGWPHSIANITNVLQLPQLIVGVCNPTIATGIVSKSIMRDNHTSECALKYRNDVRYRRQVRLVQREIENTLMPQVIEDAQTSEETSDWLNRINEDYMFVLGDATGIE